MTVFIGSRGGSPIDVIEHSMQSFEWNLNYLKKIDGV